MVEIASGVMKVNDPNFVNSLREVLRGLQEEGRRQQPRKVGGVNVNDLPKLKGEVVIWYEGLKAKRSREEKKKISSWESLKRKLRRRYVPVNHPITIIPKFSKSWKRKLDVIVRDRCD
ncbi:unnamed protein product [Lactuca virosa]|uniref:Uncharacterized protein n=1 Tax=Lactuca virosa TaxID=75947 RepID=A0AAU9P6L2_9ASTR|nr:unnamed protein product [Lactuca virosa]